MISILQCGVSFLEEDSRFSVPREVRMECVSPRRKPSRDRDGNEDLELRIPALDLLLHRTADQSRIDEVVAAMETMHQWKEAVVSSAT